MFQITLVQSNQIKGLAIFLVFIYHAFGFLRLPNYFAGQIGVDLFLFASGYGVSQSIDKYPTAFNFVRNRFVQLLPKYIAAIFFAYCLFGGFNWIDFLLHITFSHGLFPNYFFGIDNALWYMSLIFLGYFYVAIIKRFRLDEFCLILGMLLYVVAVFLYENREPVISHLVPRIPIFVIAYWIGRNQGRTYFNQKYILDIIASVIFYIVSILYLPGIFGGVGIALSLAMVLLTINKINSIAAVFSYVGMYSYEIYLLHDLVLRILVQEMQRGDFANVPHYRMIFLLLAFLMVAIATFGFVYFFKMLEVAKRRFANQLSVK